ncbi:hypothetical protein [Actibacterium sp. 188UL27-1]|uniref:hypothetical protein n=1 Tax=Actibacterium sp. 188UL27-1 TaxID=2786961 RepID=UPI0019582239|nr:hypothetical protein [Actibacterium sp. 188UL27-1]MBM7066815.1 hypothetical protein [Actibacterium sp. 188UL27-1]
MTYSMTTMRQDLKTLGVSKGINPFLWEKDKGGVHPILAGQFKHGRRKNYLNDMLEYCWLAYSKSLRAGGPMMMGRFGDLWVAEHLARAGFTSTEKETLWDPHTRGNIQVLDKWAPTVNDCWVLGGVHRRADFELVSVRTLDNLWNFAGGYHIVTAREILGLLHFGYELEEKNNKVKLVCVDKDKAIKSNIREYHRLMTAHQNAGPDSIRSVLVMDRGLQADIKGFDRSRLRSV